MTTNNRMTTLALGVAAAALWPMLAACGGAAGGSGGSGGGPSDLDPQTGATRVEGLAGDLRSAVEGGMAGRQIDWRAGYERCGVDADSTAHVQYVADGGFRVSATDLDAARTQLDAAGRQVTSDSPERLEVADGSVTGVISLDRDKAQITARTECLAVDEALGRSLLRQHPAT